jgi:hypothetical protein
MVSSTHSLEEAQGTRDEVQSSTGEPAGVLYSNDFEDLRPGYYVVFSGVFDTKGDAQAQAARLDDDYPGTYARRLVPA